MKIFYKYTNWLYKAKRLLPLKLVPWGKYFIKQKKSWKSFTFCIMDLQEKLVISLKAREIVGITVTRNQTI